jgi:hypothetical protein
MFTFGVRGSAFGVWRSANLEWRGRNETHGTYVAGAPTTPNAKRRTPNAERKTPVRLVNRTGVTATITRDSS